MLPNMRIKPSLAKVFANSNSSLVIWSSPGKYSLDHWACDNNSKLHLMKEQEKLKDRLLNNAQSTIQEVSETTAEWQERVQHLTKERIKEIAFLAEELKRQRKAVVLELETLNVICNRIIKANDFLEKTALPICQQCIMWRQTRIGTENCNDDVDVKLRKELKTIKGCQNLLQRSEIETKEQMRLLRAAIYDLDKDLEGKAKAQYIDEENYNLNQAKHFLGRGVDLSNDYCRHHLLDWYRESDRNLLNNEQMITSAGSLRWYIDLMLKEVCEDITNQTELTNEAFYNRTKDVKKLKADLEDKYLKTSTSIMEVNKTINVLEADIKDKERAILLCRTRLSNRAHRPGIELTCDYVQDALYAELNALRTTMCKLQQKLFESKAFLRYLSHTQVVQNEEINLKANTIKIDDCDCMTLRAALVYTDF